jgi:acyl-[acyl-carrier-protein]-phospholipid O-acyltransferase/long-chain-fatty-acid--[acyl-carrier-protein] ligase
MTESDSSGQKSSLLRTVVAQLRRRGRTITLSDSTGVALTGRQALISALVLRRLFARELASSEKVVGVLLPPTVAGVLANLALALERRVAVNLNYSLTPELIRASIAEAGVQHVITSRAFLKRMPLDLEPAKLIVLEELAAHVSLVDKVMAGASSFLPWPLLERLLGIGDIRAGDLMTIMFTSGSTGRPKGVLLSWRSIEANTRMIDGLLRLRPDDVMLGVLPFFHTFGYTITLWTPLAMGVGAVYHTNPLEGRVIGSLIKDRNVTIVLGTPTLLRAYMQRLPPEDFGSVELVATGSEPLPQSLADGFEERFGVRPFQGYGATELGPIVSANVPASRSHDAASSLREGSVGRPAREVRVEVRDPETGEVLGPDQPGVLWVTGPHVMLGYLDQPELTQKAIVDGWYNTGDIVSIDESGFITIVGRSGRFAKIAGEMVAFAAVEQVLGGLVGTSDDGIPRAVVTAVPDRLSGERLVVVHTALQQSPAELLRQLAASGLPRLYLPSPADFYQIETMPIIGIGKVDLKAIDGFAKEAASASRVKREIQPSR